MKKNKEKNARNDLASKIIRNRTRGYVTQRSKPFTGNCVEMYHLDYFSTLHEVYALLTC